MGITKTEGFAVQTNAMAEILKAMGHPARLSILNLLASKSSCVCTSIVDELPLAQPTISRHLAELKKVGLIQGTIEGKNICYCLNMQTLATVQEELNSLFQKMETNTKCC